MSLAPTYGATPQALEEQYFPGLLQESRRAGYDQAALKIGEVAADVAIEVRSAGIQPDVITSDGSPRAYAWLTRTILLGSAVAYGLSASHVTTDVIEVWRSEYQARIRRLQDAPRAVLDDVPGYQAGATVFNVYR